MHSTRHEKAALVGLAYGIGMLTAFIWFGSGSVPATVSTPSLGTALTASVADAVPDTASSESVIETSVASPSTSTPPPTSATRYENGILSVGILGTERVLSFNPEVSGLGATDDFLVQGVHIGSLIYAASPSEEFVFFCEQKAVEDQACTPFVYDTLTDTIYQVRKDGELVGILTSAAAKVSWTDRGLLIGKEYSKDPLQPWLIGM